ncbi:uncharacterized protein LOC110806812 isoform X1 [Carica papaya]|uniref:uncharacterized protein LOC110806812 isoform X1 n=1 Tax=Carica papaya TaxID=3649 RepID=UPI000B8CD875|nr:uncharacterized protein LOC110806812 isoform X1 [Carica papaya]
MGAPGSPPLPPNHHTFCESALQPPDVSNSSTLTLDSHLPSSICDNQRKKKKKTKTKTTMNSQKKKRLDIEDVSLSAPLSLSCSPSLNSSQRLTRVPCRRRNPAVRFGAVRPSLGWRDVNTLALSLGMSFAAFVDMVLDRKDTVAENMSIDELAKVFFSFLS